MTNSQPPQWQQLIGRIQYLAQEAGGHTKEIAALRRGNSSITEHYAYPYVLPYTSNLKSKDQQTALLRVAAMLAEYGSIPNFDQQKSGYRSFGSWCFQLSNHLADGKRDPLDPDNPDAVGQRLAYLHTQNLEEAVLSVRRLLALATSLQNPPALDKYNLAKTLIYWGNGISPASREARRQILRDYYSAFNYILTPAEENSPANDQ